MFSTVIKCMFKTWDLCSKARTSMKGLLEADMRKWREDAKGFYNIHKGKRCFIIGNGPSLAKQDLSALKNEICFCCNMMAFTSTYDALQPRYYFLSDPYYFSTETGISGEKILTEIEKREWETDLFVPYACAKEWTDRVVARDNKRRSHIHCYIEKGVFLEDTPFCANLCSGISPAYTVTQTAAMIAIFMGFSEIYLLGCDGTGIYENMALWLGPRCSENTENAAFHFDNAATDASFSMQRPLYNDIVVTLESHKNMFIGYKRLEMLCNHEKRFLCNLTEGGIVRYIPCGTLKDILKN